VGIGSINNLKKTRKYGTESWLAIVEKKINIKTTKHKQEISYKIRTTRLSSNLRPITRECVHLVTRRHFRSRDEDGGHTIRSAISENSMLHANFTALYFTEPELLPIEVHSLRNRDFRPLFCSCDLDLDPMTIADRMV